MCVRDLNVPLAFRTYIELIQSADDDEYTRRHFAHGEHVLDFDETLDASVVDERDDTYVRTSTDIKRNRKKTKIMIMLIPTVLERLLESRVLETTI